MEFRHKVFHRFKYVRDCPACDAERAAYARLDAAMARVIPEMNAELEADGSDFRYASWDQYATDDKRESK
jgi:hypothetical protein